MNDLARTELLNFYIRFTVQSTGGGITQKKVTHCSPPVDFILSWRYTGSNKVTSGPVLEEFHLQKHVTWYMVHGTCERNSWYDWLWAGRPCSIPGTDR